MKNRIRLILIIIVCFLLILFAGGCWNRHELISLSFVVGVGLDKTQEPGEIQVTTQIVKPSGLKSAEKGGGSGAEVFLNLRNTGDSVFGTIRDFTHKLSNKLYFPHNQVLIFGRDIAEGGVRKYTDIFVRDHETRLGIWVLVAKDQASEVLDVTSELGKIPAVNIAQLVKAQAATSETSAVKLIDFITRLMSKTTAPVAPLIEVVGKGKEKTVLLSGTAVFKQDKLVGQLNKSETRGLLWVIDGIKSGIIDVDCPDGKGTVSLEITRAKRKISSEIRDDKIYMKIDIKEEGNLGSQSCPENLASPEKFALLEKEKSAAIESEVMAAFKKAKELNADIFGFGDAVHQKYPTEWKDLEGRWDEIFPEIEVELTVEAKLRRTGRISKPVAPAKE